MSFEECDKETADREGGFQKHVRFHPQEDITVYELALATRLMTDCLNGGDSGSGYKVLSEGVKRHFQLIYWKRVQPPVPEPSRLRKAFGMLFSRAEV